MTFSANGHVGVTNQIALTTSWKKGLQKSSCCCCLQATEYTELSVLDRALVLEALVTIVANTELLRNHLRHLEPEGSTPLLNRGAIMGRDAAGNIYHQLGGQSARCVLLCAAAALLDSSCIRLVAGHIPQKVRVLANDLLGMHKARSRPRACLIISSQGTSCAFSLIHIAFDHNFS